MREMREHQIGKSSRAHQDRDLEVNQNDSCLIIDLIVCSVFEKNLAVVISVRSVSGFEFPL